MANADEGIIRLGVVSELLRLIAWLVSAIDGHPRIRLFRVATTFERLNPDGVDVLVLAGEFVPLQELESLVHQNHLKGVIIFTNDIEAKSIRSQIPPFPTGWLSAETDVRQFCASIEAVFAGLTVFSGRRAGGDQIEDDLASLLTEREIEVIRLIIDGLSNRQIAETLFISQNTVKYHLTNIYLKLGASRRSEAIRKAISSGIVAL